MGLRDCICYVYVLGLEYKVVGILVCLEVNMGMRRRVC